MVNDRKFPDITQSEALLQRANGLIPSQTQTLAKGPTQYVRGVAPVYLERGSGCEVTDVDGNTFIDLTMGVGPLILGYCHPEVDEAIRRQLDRGITFSLMHRLEVELSERIRQLVPGAEMVRFSKTGADVTSAAVRVARAVTGRNRVLCCGYHGWHDWYAGTLPRDAGVPGAVSAMVSSFDYNSMDSLRSKLTADVACVILEPTIFEAPNPDFLQQVRKACSDNGSLLIFDEMWTGFRIALGGAQAHYDVTADLACFSKAVANGMPLSVLTGQRRWMEALEDEVFFYTTFGGEALSLAAAQATLDVLERENVPAVLSERGRQLTEQLQRMIRSLDLEGLGVVGMPARTMLTFDARFGDPLLQKSLLQQELIRRGVLWTGFCNLAYAHDEDHLARVLAAFGESLDVLASARRDGSLAQQLRGTPVQPVFRRVR